jgi:hypothetical protein
MSTIKLTYGGGIRPRQPGEEGRIAPSPHLQAAFYGAEQLYQTAADSPHLTWRQVGAAHGLSITRPRLPKPMLLGWIETEQGQKRLADYQLYHRLPQVIRRAVEVYCSRTGHRFPFRRR